MGYVFLALGLVPVGIALVGFWRRYRPHRKPSHGVLGLHVPDREPGILLRPKGGLPPEWRL